MRSHPALIEQIAGIIHRDHLPYDQAEARNAAGWALEGGWRRTLTADELAEAYAEAMRRHAADRAARRRGRPAGSRLGRCLPALPRGPRRRQRPGQPPAPERPPLLPVGRRAARVVAPTRRGE